VAVQAKPVVVLLGPTASGKSDAALLLAERLDGEIVTLDSAQVYRGMDIGTAKPDAATRARVRHHLLDLIDPTEAYSAARFCTDAHAAVADIHARGKLPIIAGGTMLYYKALRDGLDDLPQANLAARATIEAQAKEHGWPALHARLQELDPVTAARLAPNDAQRISRALEVHATTGKALSAHFSTPNTVKHPMVVGKLGNAVMLPIALVPSDRSALHTRIAQRFDAMLRHGLLDELRGLQARYPLTPDMPSMRCVGYRQAWVTLAGEQNLVALRETGIAATRQLAKRQLTWLRGMTEVETIDCCREDAAQEVLALAQMRLAQYDGR
jgi:tRNA dimethylallyltransferase